MLYYRLDFRVFSGVRILLIPFCLSRRVTKVTSFVLPFLSPCFRFLFSVIPYFLPSFFLHLRIFFHSCFVHLASWVPSVPHHQAGRSVWLSVSVLFRCWSFGAAFSLCACCRLRWSLVTFVRPWSLVLNFRTSVPRLFLVFFP